MFLAPGWVALHLLVWAAAVTMTLLGRWQLGVSNTKHFDLQNFGYALQWWAFAAFAILLWLRAIRDAWRGGGTEVASTGGELAVRAGQAGAVAPVGPVNLVTRPDKSGAAPITYRGYRMPQSAMNLAGVGSDHVQGAYNDYLWQLSLADAAEQAHRPAQQPFTHSPSDAQPAGTPPTEDDPSNARVIDAGTPAIDAEPGAGLASD